MTNGTEMPTRETDFFQKTFDHKNRLASIILRTSHQAHIYNECDIEATGGDSVDLRKEIVVVKSLSHVRFFATPWTVAHQVPWSTGFSRHEYWSGLPFSSPGGLPDPGIEPRSPAL